MRKSLIFLLVVAIFCSLFISCAQPISEEKEEVDAVIIKVRNRVVRAGSAAIVKKEILFEFEGIEGKWEVSQKIYTEYRGKEGETIPCYLITYTYEDGSTRIDLVAKEDVDS